MIVPYMGGVKLSVYPEGLLISGMGLVKRMKVSEQHLRYLLAHGAVEGKKWGRDWMLTSLDYQRK